MIGKVKGFNNTKGYGFIKYNDVNIFECNSTIEVDVCKNLSGRNLIRDELSRIDKGLQVKKYYK